MAFNLTSTFTSPSSKEKKELLLQKPEPAKLSKIGKKKKVIVVFLVCPNQKFELKEWSIETTVNCVIVVIKLLPSVK